MEFKIYDYKGNEIIVKDFDYYYKDYCHLHFLSNSNFNYETQNEKAKTFLELFKRKLYNDIPFEIKFGLLKLIHDDNRYDVCVNYTFTDLLLFIKKIILNNFTIDISTLNPVEKRIISICSIDYIKSLNI